jgi:hypothetical protein
VVIENTTIQPVESVVVQIATDSIGCLVKCSRITGDFANWRLSPPPLGCCITEKSMANDVQETDRQQVADSIGPSTYTLKVEPASTGTQINFLEILRFLRRRLVLISCAGVIGAALGGLWVLVATPIYRVEAVVVTVSEEESASLMGALQSSFGGLAGLAGLPLGGAGLSSVESIAKLRSRSFIQDFISDENLLPILFPKRWDGDAGVWIADESDPPPTLQDGYELFINDVYKVSEDRQSGLVTLRIDWSDRILAANWANDMISRINRVIRSNVIEQSDVTLAYLQEEIQKTNIVALKNVLYTVVESQIQKRTLAKTRPDYAFRVIDPAIPPDVDRNVWPSPILAIPAGLVAGMFIGLCFGIWQSRRDFFRGSEEANLQRDE